MLTNKKYFYPVLFLIGLLMFSGVVLADMGTDSAYEQLKRAMKKTISLTNTDVSANFTSVAEMKMTDNGRLLEHTKNLRMQDDKTNTSLDRNERLKPDGNYMASIFYRNSQESISYDEGSDSYYLTKLHNQNMPPEGENRVNRIIEDERFKDIERIADAAVGNLKFYLNSEEKPEGTLITFSFTETQIPALVRAVGSFAVKQMFGNSYGNSERINKYPELVKEISLNNADGKVLIENDILLDLEADLEFSGVDRNGETHKVKINVSYRTNDIGTTIVKRPDLSGMKVVVNEAVKTAKRGYEKYVGKYSCDIVATVDNKFIKAGECTLDVKSFSDNTLNAVFTETYDPEYIKTIGITDKNDRTIPIEVRIDPDENDFYEPLVSFEYQVEGTKMQGQLFFDDYRASINVSLSTSDKFTKPYYSGGSSFDLKRVFD